MCELLLFLWALGMNEIKTVNACVQLRSLIISGVINAALFSLSLSVFSSYLNVISKQCTHEMFAKQPNGQKRAYHALAGTSIESKSRH